MQATAGNEANCVSTPAAKGQMTANVILRSALLAW